jgi:preprotein translocase subunit SecD
LFADVLDEWMFRFKAKVSGSDRFVYLHQDEIVTNADIADARIVPAGNPSRFSVNVEFNASGAEKMRVATDKNIGKHIAILLDGQVVMTPVLRSAIYASAQITGDLTRTQGERIVHGIRVQ